VIVESCLEEARSADVLRPCAKPDLSASLGCDIRKAVRAHGDDWSVGSPRTAIVALGVWALLAGCGSDEGTLSNASPQVPQPSASETTSPPQAVSELEGSWQTDPVSQRDAEVTLRQQGLGKWIEQFRPLSPIVGDIVLTLVIDNGNWDLYGQPEGGSRSEIDYDAEYSVDGDLITVIHGDGTRTLRWVVNGDTLTLDSIKTTLGPTGGIPDEVFQVALYKTAEFMRQS
jgi:hypothetical protein